MLETTTIRTRLDRKTKEASDAVLEDIGRIPNALTAKTLDWSAANHDVEYFSDRKLLIKSWVQ